MQENKNIYQNSFNEKYTFETFLIGDNNCLAYAAAFEVAIGIGEIHNPLYIYGFSGVGKTHLLQAVGNHISQKNPEKKIIYVTAQEFVNIMIETIQSGDEVVY